MKPQELVIQIIDNISSMFSHISFIYGFDAFANQHIIKVHTDDENISEAFIDAESDAILSFIQQFPDESILFSINNPYIQIAETLHVKSASISIKMAEITQLQEKFTLQFRHSICMSKESLEAYNFLQLENNPFVMEKRLAVNIKTSKVSLIETAEEYSYAMAA